MIFDWFGKLAFIGLIVSLAPAPGQNHSPPSYRIVEHHDYEEVLDLVFKAYEPVDRNLDQFILRFEPSRQPESFLTIVWKGNNVSVVQCTAANGQVWAILNEMLNRSGVIDKEAAAKSVQVNCRELRVSRAKANDWRSRFFVALGQSASSMSLRNAEHQSTGKVIVTLDGTTYQIAYAGYPADISLTLQDVEVGANDAHSPIKLVRWAAEIRGEISRMKEDGGNH